MENGGIMICKFPIEIIQTPYNKYDARLIPIEGYYYSNLLYKTEQIKLIVSINSIIVLTLPLAFRRINYLLSIATGKKYIII